MKDGVDLILATAIHQSQIQKVSIIQITKMQYEKIVKTKLGWLWNNEYVLIVVLWVDLPTCVHSEKIGNGICDGDINVGGNCEFDGGDCCKFLIDDSGCSGESCVCNEDNLLHFSLEE